ncbi:hypothetical protein ABZ490_42595 [Streptomyces sp. NPDC005811]|uniref:hypothetical protein n=1 Tax=Streptomyces sp. NPDC005811 TaxID=3154565 RepID=UPI0033C4162A
MTEATASEPDERVLGRRWTVRLDPAGRGSTAVRVSCSRPACAEQRLPSAAAGRAAAVEHLKSHLRAVAEPRAGAYCACRAESCRTHLSPADRQPGGQPWRCGGAVVLAVVGDRQGRWWQAMECCARCAAATPGAKVVTTTPVPSGPAGDRPSTAPAGAPRFSDTTPPSAGPRGVPAPRSSPAPHPRPHGRIAQRIVPHELRPTPLRDELTALGDQFRAYQKQPEPDLALLADLHERKARAFTTWAEVTGDTTLRREAQRAEQAAAAARSQHLQRTGLGADADGPAVSRVLNVPAQWEHVRSVLTYVAEHSPLPGPDARLLVLMLTLRTAHGGTGNVVGQDITALGLTEPPDLVEELIDCGWLVVPGTAEELLAARPESPIAVTVPSLALHEDGSGPFAFGRKTRPRLSGWAQKIVSDKKLRKAGATAGTRLLALTLATHTDGSGRLGTDDRGIALGTLTTAIPVDPGALRQLLDQLTAAAWLTEATLTDTHLTGHLTERVLPLTCPIRQTEEADRAG